MKKNKYYDLEKHINEHHKGIGSQMADIILGMQDGLVNTLGVVLGLVAATNDFRTIMIAGLAVAFAESFSMAAVAYTSTRAEITFYNGQKEKEKKEIEDDFETEKKEVYEVYHRKGFSGKLLKQIVEHITSSKERFLDFMMREELQLKEPEKGEEFKVAFVVGISAFIGSLVPVIPFIIQTGMSTHSAGILSVLITSITLFGLGFYKAKTTSGEPVRSGVEFAIIGMTAAMVGFGAGSLIGMLI